MLSVDHTADEEPRTDITRLLADVAAGRPEADSELVAVAYGELKRIAQAKLAAARPDQTLQPTALVHEAYLRLLGPAHEYHDRGHFFAAAAMAMRRILVDHARGRLAQKRGGGARPLELHPGVGALYGMPEDGDPLERILAVNEALERFAHGHVRQSKVVELLFFAGLSVEEAAKVLGVSGRTIKRDWSFARAWLARAIGNEKAED